MLLRGHIASDVLLEYAENRTDPATTARVRAHLDAGCARCAEELAAWYHIVTALEADRASAPPEEVRQQAFRLFDRLTRAPSAQSRVIAVPVFDSRRRPALGATRAGGSVSYDLLFEADDTSITLLCEHESEQWQIAGQVLSVEATLLDWKVSLASAGGSAETSTDALGEFRLRGIAPGVYDLTLREVNREIVLPNIELRD